MTAVNNPTTTSHAALPSVVTPAAYPNHRPAATPVLVQTVPLLHSGMRYHASLVLLTVTLGGCASATHTAEHVALASIGSPTVSEGVFGEWVSQIIRTPAKVDGQPATFQGAAIYDEELRERRPMLALTLADDGTFALITNYSPTERSIVFGTWAMTGAKVALEQNGDVTWVFVSHGGKLIAEKNDGPTVILGRK